MYTELRVKNMYSCNSAKAERWIKHYKKRKRTNYVCTYQNIYIAITKWMRNLIIWYSYNAALVIIVHFNLIRCPGILPPVISLPLGAKSPGISPKNP